MHDILLPHNEINKLIDPATGQFLLLDIIYVDKYGFFLYVFSVYKKGGYKKIGRITLWMATHEDSYIKGNIGYNIHKNHRRRGFAKGACIILLRYLKTKNVQNLLITCNPDNIATRRICKALGAKHIDTTPVPPKWRDHHNKKTKLVYEITL